MRFKEYLLEGDVIKGDFGKGHSVDGIEIPKGYKSFYAKRIGTKNSAQIIGVKADGKEVVISTTTFELAEALAKYYTTGKTTKDLAPVSASSAFTNDGYNILRSLGFVFLEKPDTLSYVRNTRKIDQVSMKKIERVFKEYGLKLNEYDSEKIYGENITSDEMLKSTMKSVKWKPEEDIFIVKFSKTGNRFLVDGSGAKTYIRFWMFIKD